MSLRKHFELREDDLVHVPLENIWTRAKRWARRHGKEYVATYGVVDVAPL